MNGSKALGQLTDRQRLMMDFIVYFMQKHEVPPTWREMGKALGISSTNAVHDYVKAFEKKGYVIPADKSVVRSRFLRLTDAAKREYGLLLPTDIHRIASMKIMLANRETRIKRLEKALEWAEANLGLASGDDDPEYTVHRDKIISGS